MKAYVLIDLKMGNLKPENLFANYPEVEIFGNDWWGGCFCGCENLMGKIPENLFKNNKKVKKFSWGV